MSPEQSVPDTGTTRRGSRASMGRIKRFGTAIIALAALAVPLVAVAGSGAEAANTGAVSERTDSMGLETPSLTARSFADPPAAVRPMYYWWMPQAETDDAELAAEVRAMAQAGAGGALIAPTQRPSDAEKYGWGTPAWAHKVETMLTAAKANGLELDFSQGPFWPAMVPTVADVNDPRASQQLIFSYELHAGGTTRDGALPDNFDVKPPAGAEKTLIAALVARCEQPSCASLQPGSPRLLDRASVKDLTAQVDSDGSLHYEFPGDAGSTYALLAFYQTATGQSYQGFTAGPMYVLDHLSAAGARATTDYFDEHIITPAAQRLIDKMGNVGFYENSIEPGNGFKWTWDFAQQWQRRRGYPVTSALPALTAPGIQKGFPGRPVFDFGGGVGERMRTDYLQTFSDLYIDKRLRTLRDWAHGHGIHTDAQPYGPPIDTAAASSHIDVPGGESHNFGDDGAQWLAFGNNVIEKHKVTAVGAHMSGTSLVDHECCALMGSVWASRVAGRDAGNHVANLPAVYDGLAGGATRVVWHGFPYLELASGPRSLWPGGSYGGNTSYAEAFGPNRNPNWADYRRVNDHLARLGLVLRQGSPRFDVAVYRHDFGLHGDAWTGADTNKFIPSNSPLAAAGYTYEYLSPEYLRSPDATYRGGALFPDRSAYRALVLNDQVTLPLDVARRILDRAQQGLRVVIVGRRPRSTPGYQDAAAQDAELGAVIDRLVALPSVTRVQSADDIPAALRRAGVRAAAAHETASSDILSVRRHTGDADYYFLYNQTPTGADQRVTLTGDGVPYRLDSWTGKITRITDYEPGPGTVTVPVHLHGNDTAVIALAAPGNPVFADAPREPRPNAPSSTAGLAPRRLTDWSLTVDSWTPGPSGLPGDTAHTDVGPVSPAADTDGRLPAWTAITPANGYSADLADVSGIGTYTTHVNLGDDWDPVQGAQLSLGEVVDTSAVSVNGRQLAPLDYTDVQHIEVGPYLHEGENTITVRVASTLLNAVRVAPGTGASGRARMDYGLLGPVTLTPETPVAIERLEDALPLADGGYNRARIRVTNNTRHEQQITLTAATPEGITAQPDRDQPIVGAGESITVDVDLRNTGHATGTSTLTVTAHGDHDAHAETSVSLIHSDDLARNDLGTPFPRPFASADQAAYTPARATDGSRSTFWVSGWSGPSTTHPVMLGVDLGAPTDIDSVTVVGRSLFQPTAYDIQTSDDRRAWTTVATVADPPTNEQTTTFPTVHARYLRLRITDTAAALRSPVNVQVIALEVRG